MLTRRDVAKLTWYSLLFSSIVFWAALRPSGSSRSMSRNTARSVPADDGLERSETQPEMRRIVQRMMTH